MFEKALLSFSKIKSSILDRKREKKMSEKAKFKVEVEIEVEYEKVECLETTPYTSADGYGCDGKGVIALDKGRILDVSIKKLERKK